MLTPTTALLRAAHEGEYALGAFNVYNLEGVRAVLTAAESERSPAILQIHPSALKYGGLPLVGLCLSSARLSAVPIAVHLDHSTSAEDIRAALSAGVNSVMADGSSMSYEQNVACTREMAQLAQGYDAAVEAELGRLTGTEDGLTVPEYEAKLTDPAQAVDFVKHTGIAALAVCIGNVHGHYKSEPRLDFDRLAALAQSVPVPLVLHGASGLPDETVTLCIRLGVRKFNVNTEVREAYVESLARDLGSPGSHDLLELMGHATDAMRAVVVSKLRLFGSAGKAG